MRTTNGTRINMSRACVFLALIIAGGLAISGCGQVASLEEIGPGSGNSLLLNWTAPTTNEDGSPLSDLAGYKLYYGTQSGQYTNVITIGDFTSAEIDNLDPGTYYVAVTAYDIYGNESTFSNEIDHTFF